jgi:uncharacterized protein (TIGR03437 family)
MLNLVRFLNVKIPSQLLATLLVSTALAMAAPPSRITRPLDASRTAVIPGHVHRLAQPQFDRGAVDPAKELNYMVLLVKPSAAQQTDLESLLLDQQNPSSARFRSWLTPEQFGSRFGLNASDQSKIVAWLTSSGFAVDHQARSANWIAFSGSAAQVSNALHTPIHQFEVGGKVHFANTSVPSVPDAMADVVAGFIGLDDFQPAPHPKLGHPDDTTPNAHYLAPADFATIYDVAPLYAAGIDGTGQSIAIVGESDVLLSDITAFRTRYGLPANSPKMILYGNTDPGFNGDWQAEGNLDLEWAGAIAPKATVYFVYGPNALTAIIAAVEADYAPVISASYLLCEVDGGPGFRSVVQQGNAEGITILAASGDAGAAGCDAQGEQPFASLGRSVVFPADLPEVTGVGGTQFMEGSGAYWATTNSPQFGSALSYIPEAVWNETASLGEGLLAGGGGASAIYSKPLWQAGPGMPADNARDVPDVSFSAALHDGYLITYLGSNTYFGGTSASTPSMAGIVALLNQYQVTNKFQKTAGLGNINPQLYRLAQAAPTSFHDVTAGNNVVPCAQGSPDCLTGSFGYSAGVAYDLATGLGSLDVNNLATQWNTAAGGSIVTLSASATRATLNDTIQLTAAVTPATGSGTPTGTVNFLVGTVSLGSASLVNGSAAVTVPLYEIGQAGAALVVAEYSGDASFSASSATKTIQVTYPPGGVTSIVPSAPTTVWPDPPDAQGLSWQTVITLNEVAGNPAFVTGLSIDGVAQTLSQYFPSPDITPGGSVNVNFVFRGLNPPVTRTFVFTGTDPTGLAWSRQVAVTYFPLPTQQNFSLIATPLTAVQNPASSTCPWSVQLNVDEIGGYGGHQITNLYSGSLDISANILSIFGTARLDAYDGVQGTLCYSSITPPGTDQIAVVWDEAYEIILNVNFAGPPANPGTLSATPSTLSLAAAKAGQPATTTLSVNLSDKTQNWTAAVFPANLTTSWLSASQLSGTGTGTITLTANGTGFEPGVYRATIVFQSQNSVPQYINVPIMFVLGGSTTGTSITSATNSASFKPGASPGMLMTVFGTGLANSTATAPGAPSSYTLAGVSATVNGLAASMNYVSSGMLNIQVPFSAGAGPAVLGINNNGQIAAYQFQISAYSPGIFADANGNVVPVPTVKQGSLAALYVTGMGSVSLPSFSAPALPLSVTVGGVPVFVDFAGTPFLGYAQVNILVPASVPTGNQPVVVTVGGVPSAPVNIVVQP